MPLATDFNISFGWPDFNQGTSQDSKQNIIVALQTGQIASGAYGTDWSGALATLPGTPDGGKWLFRINTDTDGFAIYIWDDNISDWRFVPIAGGVTVTTPGITTIAAGTPINYGSSGLNNHTMSIKGNDNTGTFTSATVQFQISVDGTNFETLFELEVSSSNLFELFPFPTPAPTVKSRYNVSEITVVGDANLSVTITSN